MTALIVIAVGIILHQVVSALFFGTGIGGDDESLFAIARHNRAIDKQWEKNGRPVLSTTVGWRPDPHNKQDGCRDNGDLSYSKLLRGGTKEYREKFARDVEEARK